MKSIYLRALAIAAIEVPFATLLWLCTFSAGSEGHRIAKCLGYSSHGAEFAGGCAGVMAFFSVLALGIVAGFYIFNLPDERERTGSSEEADE